LIISSKFDMAASPLDSRLYYNIFLEIRVLVRSDYAASY
jgi:hypothetical protein